MFRLLSVVLPILLFTGNWLALPPSAWSQEKKEVAKKKKNDGEGKKSKKQSQAAGTYFQVEKLNAGLPKLDEPLDRSTPQAAMESFYDACKNEDYSRAAHVLDLRKLSPEEQKRRGAELARKLHYVLNQKFWVDWDSLSSRPSALMDSPAGTKHPMAGKPQKSLLLKKIDVQGRVATVRLHRVKPADGDPVWVFSYRTVAKVEPLYQEYGPTWFQQSLPGWAKANILAGIRLWEWIVLGLALVVAVLLGWLTQRAIRVSANKSPVEGYSTYAKPLRLPAAVTVGTLFFYLVNVLLLRLPGPVSFFLHPLMLIAFVASVCWVLLRLLNVFSEHVIQTYIEGLEEGTPGAERQLLTQLSVGRRLVALIGVCIAVGVVLLQLKVFEVVGVGLLASAGVVGIVLGIAAKPVLGNLIAGMQIAVTRPVRISDVVVYAGEWGYVENVTFAYLVIRTWDSRRLMVPLQHFISNPVENWSKINTHLVKPIYMYVDYRTDVDAVRDKFAELLRDCEDWDEEVEPQVLVTDLKEETMELRALCSAKDASKAWYLHCYLREEMIKFIREQQDGQFLPRQRLHVEPVTVQEQKKRRRKSTSAS